MREIKFRAWDKKQRAFINGFNMIGFSTGQGAPNKKLQRFSSYWDEEDIELMQYTGLKDKNGKEIYEGDILEFYDIYGAVKFGLHSDNVYNGWYVEVKSSGTQCELNESFQFSKVMGNIFDNPELLNQPTTDAH
ncbi:MAG TPA: YopX family protein [Mobilitalea sp.]|nr:YopX family protein [Mobilitalea sp.]